MFIQVLSLKCLDDLLVYLKAIEKMICVYFFEDDFIGNAIIEAQNIYWEEQGKESQFSHIGFIGNDFKFYESTVNLKTKLVYGVCSNPVEVKLKKWYKYKKLAIQVLPEISKQQWIQITESAKKEVGKVHYGGIELFGTLINLIRWKFTFNKEKRKKILREKNPFDDKNAKYCISFVNDCIKSAGIDFTDKNINPTILTVDHGWNSLLKNDRFFIRKKG